MSRRIRQLCSQSMLNTGDSRPAPSHTPFTTLFLSPSFPSIQVHFSDENVSTLHFDLVGPVDTPFEGGLFRIKLSLPSDYPNSAPKGWFLTKIFHPNVNFKTGEICVSTLKKDWSKTTGLKHVLVVIRCLLIEPNPESALNEDAGKLLLENYADYFARAKMMTKVHAKPTAGASETATEQDTAVAATAPIAGEEENNTLQNVAAAPVASVAAPAVKKPLSVSSAGNAATAATAAVTKPAAASAAAAAAEKAKALKKKSLKRL